MIEQNRSRDYEVAAIARILKDDFHFTQWAYLMPLVGETTGHLDMFLTIVDPATVVRSSYDAEEDAANAARMDEHAKTLSTLRVDGAPLRIVRIPAPAARDGVWRTVGFESAGREAEPAGGSHARSARLPPAWQRSSRFLPRGHRP